MRCGSVRFGRSGVGGVMWSGQACWGNAGIARCDGVWFDQARIGWAGEVGYGLPGWVFMVRQVRRGVAR